MVRGEDLDRFFLGAGNRNGDAVEHQTPRGFDRRPTEIGIIDRGDPLAKLCRHRHGGLTCSATNVTSISGR